MDRYAAVAFEASGWAGAVEIAPMQGRRKAKRDGSANAPLFAQRDKEGSRYAGRRNSDGSLGWALCLRDERGVADVGGFRGSSSSDSKRDSESVQS